MTFVFASDLWNPGEDYEPPAITHPDARVMQLTRALMAIDPESFTYEYNVDGATQGSAYHEKPYRRTIADYIERAIKLKAILDGEENGHE